RDRNGRRRTPRGGWHDPLRARSHHVFFFKQKTAYDIGLGIPAEPLFRSEVITFWVCKLLMLICILTKNVITSCSVTMMLFLHLEIGRASCRERVKISGLLLAVEGRE